MEKLALFLLLLPLLCVADKCIPDCIPNAKSPNDGGTMCKCTVSAALAGCQISACNPGEDSSGEYTCMCTPENHQRGCVNPRCNNGTLSASTAGLSAGTESVVCNKPCNCRIQPDDCTLSSGRPIDGAPPCTCSTERWPTGCTMRPCRLGDTHDDAWFCECTKDYAPSFCYTPIC